MPTLPARGCPYRGREHYPPLESGKNAKALGSIIPVTTCSGGSGEIKRRADVLADIFPKENPITRRLVGAILLEQNDKYAIQKHYMSLESLATMGDNPTLRLPAIAAA